ncbi:MAG TPA: glucose-1-phosphate thymidylyltransferase [Thermoplasmata archaeon]|nr:glucose-1-phosphate thymidylyltransferase [Thermoplasmata archaeon]
MKGLLLAGGHGTRLRPLTFTGNKHMIPVANRPILLYGLEHLKAAGIRKVAIVLGPMHEGIQEAVGDGSRFGLEVSYIHQGPPKGLAHAVACAREFLDGEPFVMYLGDNLLQDGVRPFVATYEASRPDAVIGATPVPDPRQYGVVELDGERIVSIEEKPAHPKSNLALVGVYLFTPSVFEVIDRLKPSARNELEITEAIWGLLESGRRVVVQHVRGWWKDTGLPTDLLEANERVLSTLGPKDVDALGEVRPGARVRGLVGMGRGTIVEAGAEVEGPAILGEGVRIGPGTRVGPGTSVGAGGVLLGCSVRRSILLDRVRVEGPVQLVNSILGRDVTVRSARPSETEAEIIVGDSARIVL